MTPRTKQNFLRGLTGWLFLTPGALVVGACVVLPTLVAAALSLTQCSRFRAAHWTGLDNYRRLLADPLTLKALGNTVTYLLAFVPLNLALSMAAALLLARRFPLMRLVRSIYFVPVAVSGVVAVSVFRFLLDMEAGPLNALLASIGYAPVDWLGDKAAMISIVAMTLWKSTAFFSIILLAALQDVPRELHEAAAVDGAGPVRRFFHVTLPSLAPVILLIVTLSSIGAFRVFEPMFILTPDRDATLTLALHAYNAAFRTGDIGYGNAVSFLLLALVLAATLLLNRAARRFQ